MRLIFLLSLVSLSISAEDKLAKVGHDLNLLRNNMSKTLVNKKEITPQDFQNTCGMVGKKIKALGETGIKVKQLSHKNRNPDNAVTAEIVDYYSQFQNNTKLIDLPIILKGRNYALKRIAVEQSCLKCHGAENLRPEFIKNKYPQDKAHSFKVGELRGVYLIGQD
jgi:hypothetical protein